MALRSYHESPPEFDLEFQKFGLSRLENRPDFRVSARAPENLRMGPKYNDIMVSGNSLNKSRLIRHFDNLTRPSGKL